MSILSDHDRKQLQQMMQHNGDMEDNTLKIRESQHSGEIRRCIQHIAEYKRLHPTLLKENKTQFEEEVLREASFLFYHYMPIYNLVLKQDDLTVLTSLLDVLEKIEQGKYDESEGSYIVGKLLKEMYIDTVLRETSAPSAPPRAQGKTITWSEYKRDLLC
jgi:hypothetical protein